MRNEVEAIETISDEAGVAETMSILVVIVSVGITVTMVSVVNNGISRRSHIYSRSTVG